MLTRKLTHNGGVAKTNAETQADYRKRLADRKLREVRGVHVPAEDHDGFKADMQRKAARIVAKRAKEKR